MTRNHDAGLDQELYLLKNKVVDYTMVVISSIAVISQSFVIYRDISYGNIGMAFYVQNVAILYLFLITIFRKRLRLDIKVFSIASIVFFVFVSGIYKYGFFASAKIYVAIGPIFLSFLIARKKSTFILIFFVITYLVLGYLYTSGVLNYPGDEITFIRDYIDKFYLWFVEALVIIFTSWGLLYVGSKFEEALTRNYRQIKKQNLELEKHQEELEVKIAERTKELAESNQALQDSITKLKKTQSQLVQSEKMASLGILTAGITHEINNPLNYIMGGVQGLEVLYEEYDESSKKDFKILVDTIKHGVERTSLIVNSLDNFNIDKSDNHEKCQIEDIIDDTLTLLKNKYEERIEIRKDFEATSQIVKGNKGELMQIFLNVILNAIQAIEHSGTIAIKTRNAEEDLLVIIEDTGGGISKVNQKYIFDPFFTTRDPGNGTGLGLSITYKLISRLGGSINITSQVNNGTTVNIKFPAYGE